MVCLLCTVVGCAQATENRCVGGYADALNINGQVEHPVQLALPDLLDYPTSSLEVTYYSGSEGLVTRRFTGVSLVDLLKASIIRTDPDVKNDIIRKYVVITATDCYKTVLSVADLLPEYGGQQVLIAYGDGDGNPLYEEGLTMLVLPGDKRASRYVSNIAEIRVRSAR
jgi:DMSO/TMAO reductase YedYZ molybdopterin-dependent catalytic subunit